MPSLSDTAAESTTENASLSPAEVAEGIARDAQFAAEMAEGAAERAQEAAQELAAQEAAAETVRTAEAAATEAAIVASSQINQGVQEWQTMMQTQVSNLEAQIRTLQAGTEELLTANRTMAESILAIQASSSAPDPGDTKRIAPATSVQPNETGNRPPSDPAAEVPQEPAAKPEPQKPRRSWI